MLNLPINVRRVTVIIGMIMLVFIVLEFNRRLEELTLLNKQNEFVQAQATQSMQTQTALQTQVAYAGSTNAVEEWARTDGHYIQDGDLPVVPIGQPGSAPIEMSTPAPTPTPMQNWQVWWDLFFGEH
jgi:cell division protein FtsB